MTMAAGKDKPDPAKVFNAIAMIVSAREEAVVRLKNVRRAQEVRKAG
jgi:hypothetical protein